MLAGRCLCTVILALLCCSHQALAGGKLSFLTLTSTSNVTYNYRGPVPTGTRFGFGNGHISSVYVSKNGYFSMGVAPQYVTPGSIPGSSSYSIVAPFAADIDITRRGSVKYTQFTTSDPQMSRVSSFIRSQTRNTFYGTRMMVAEWNGVPKNQGSIFTTNTFQGILIGDSSSSYAVFIYKCDNMEWGGGRIGWQDDNLYLYNSHYLSGRRNSNDVGCLYSNTYSAVVFKIDINVQCTSSLFRCYDGRCVLGTHRCTGTNSCLDGSDEDGCPAAPTTSSPCPSDEFACDNGNCRPDSYRCDGYNDCGDNSDEVGCGGSDGSVNAAGLAVGLTFGVIFLLCIVGVPICIGVVICYSTNKSSQRPLRTHVVATTPATGATVVTSNQTTSAANTNLYAQSQYPQQPQPPVLYSQPQYPQYPQQSVYKDAQLSFQQPPPSYDAVTAAANSTQQIPLQNVPYPVQNQAYPGYPPAGPPPNQAYPPPIAPPPHDVTGNVNNAGYLLQE